MSRSSYRDLKGIVVGIRQETYRTSIETIMYERGRKQQRSEVRKKYIAAYHDRRTLMPTSLFPHHYLAESGNSCTEQFISSDIIVGRREGQWCKAKFEVMSTKLRLALGRSPIRLMLALPRIPQVSVAEIVGTERQLHS